MNNINVDEGNGAFDNVKSVFTPSTEPDNASIHIVRVVEEPPLPPPVEDIVRFPPGPESTINMFEPATSFRAEGGTGPDTPDTNNHGELLTYESIWVCPTDPTLSNSPWSVTTRIAVIHIPSCDYIAQDASRHVSF
jgi:hypothetical protein